MNSRQAVLVKQSTKGALGRLCRFSRVLQEYSGGCAGIEEYYSSTRGAVLLQRLQRSTIGTSGRLCWFSRVLNEHSGCSTDIEVY